MTYSQYSVDKVVEHESCVEYMKLTKCFKINSKKC